MAAAGKVDIISWPQKSGFLSKMGNNVMGSLDWKKRWVVVKENGVLYYYKNKSDSSPVGRIILKDCTVRPGTQKNHSISISNVGRTYHFAAESKDEYNSWMAILDINVVRAKVDGKAKGKSEDKMRLKSAPEWTPVKPEEMDEDDFPCSLRGQAKKESGEPILTGYLNKMGNNAVKDWPKRWCVLTKENLTYWRKQDDPAPAGTIPLASLHICQDPNRTNCLELVTPTRCYYFQADDLAMAIKWACALDNAIREVRKRLGEDVLSAMGSEELHAKSVSFRAQKTGYLNKAGKNVLQQWPKRFLILRDDLLYYYKTNTDDKPLGVINLLLCTIKPNVPEKKFDIILPTRTYFFSADTSEDVVQWTEALTNAHDKIYDDLSSNTAKLQVHRLLYSLSSCSFLFLQNSTMSSSVAKYEKGVNVSGWEEKKIAESDKPEDNSAKDRLLEFAKEVSLTSFCYVLI
jgi:hypothetical protein